jgi:hypothetical protein
MTVAVRLSLDDALRAGIVGLRRQLESVYSGRALTFPERRPNESWENHVIGAMAELAVAQYLELDWAGHVNHFGKPDLIANGLGVEVRYSPKWTSIKVRPKDPDDVLVVGVTGKPPSFEIVGFVRAKTAKLEPTRSPAPGSPAHFVPMERALPIGRLKDWIHKEKPPGTSRRPGVVSDC